MTKHAVEIIHREVARHHENGGCMHYWCEDISGKSINNL